MTTLNLAVGAGADDGYYATLSGFDAAGTFISVGTESSAAQDRDLFARFNGVTIGNADTINTAVLTLTGQFGETTAVEFLIDGNDEDTATSITSTGTFTGATRTTAAVNWDFSTTWTNNSTFPSPDIATVIQEIVDRAGWASGNDMQIFVRNDQNTNGNRRRSPHSYNSASSKAPKLDIDYTAGGGGGGALPWLYRSFTQTLGAGFGGGQNV